MDVHIACRFLLILDLFSHGISVPIFSNYYDSTQNQDYQVGDDLRDSYERYPRNILPNPYFWQQDHWYTRSLIPSRPKQASKRHYHLFHLTSKHPNAVSYHVIEKTNKARVKSLRHRVESNPRRSYLNNGQYQPYPAGQSYYQQSAPGYNPYSGYPGGYGSSYPQPSQNQYNVPQNGFHDSTYDDILHEVSKPLQYHSNHAAFGNINHHNARQNDHSAATGLEKAAKQFKLASADMTNMELASLVLFPFTTKMQKFLRKHKKFPKKYYKESHKKIGDMPHKLNKEKEEDSLVDKLIKNDGGEKSGSNEDNEDQTKVEEDEESEDKQEKEEDKNGQKENEENVKDDDDENIDEEDQYDDKVMKEEKKVKKNKHKKENDKGDVKKENQKDEEDDVIGDEDKYDHLIKNNDKDDQRNEDGKEKKKNEKKVKDEGNASIGDEGKYGNLILKEGKKVKEEKHEEGNDKKKKRLGDKEDKGTDKVTKMEEKKGKSKQENYKDEKQTENDKKAKDKESDHKTKKVEKDDKLTKEKSMKHKKKGKEKKVEDEFMNEDDKTSTYKDSWEEDIPSKRGKLFTSTKRSEIPHLFDEIANSDEDEDESKEADGNKNTESDADSEETEDKPDNEDKKDESHQLDAAKGDKDEENPGPMKMEDEQEQSGIHESQYGYGHLGESVVTDEPSSEP